MYIKTDLWQYKYQSHIRMSYDHPYHSLSSFVSFFCNIRLKSWPQTKDQSGLGPWALGEGSQDKKDRSVTWRKEQGIWNQIIWDADAVSALLPPSSVAFGKTFIFPEPYFLIWKIGIGDFLWGLNEITMWVKNPTQCLAHSGYLANGNLLYHYHYPHHHHHHLHLINSNKVYVWRLVIVVERGLLPWRAANVGSTVIQLEQFRWGHCSEARK